MGLISKTVNIIPKSKQITYFKKLGYKFDKNEVIEINVLDLPKGSHINIDAECDCCGKKKTMRYDTYNRLIKNDGIYRCFECAQIYRKQNLEAKYGVDNLFKLQEYQDKANMTKIARYGTANTSSLPEVRQRYEETMQRRYGVTQPMYSEELKARMRKSNNEKYGYDSVLQSPDIRAKANQTIKQKYNVDNVSQSEEIKKKKEQTVFSHYGVKNQMQCQEIVDKVINTNKQKYNVMYSCQAFCIPFSKQQKYICDLYHMSLNYPIDGYTVDMIDIDNNLICEYDGSGHMLSVAIGSTSLEEYNHKQMIRSITLKQNGYKVLRIISKKDKIPSDVILLLILQDAKQYFSDYPNHSWITFNIDEGTVESAEFKRSYFYGELRKIKKFA